MAENPVKHSVTSTTQGAHREVSRLSTAWSCRAVNLREKKKNKKNNRSTWILAATSLYPCGKN